MKLTITVDLEDSAYFKANAQDEISSDVSLAVAEALNTPCGPSGCVGTSLEGIAWRIEQ